MSWIRALLNMFKKGTKVTMLGHLGSYLGSVDLENKVLELRTFFWLLIDYLEMINPKGLHNWLGIMTYNSEVASLSLLLPFPMVLSEKEKDIILK